jgi:alpha-1,2-mannosyltransferase
MTGFLGTLNGGRELGGASPERSNDSRRALIIVGFVALVAGLYAWTAFAVSFRYDGVIAPYYNVPGSDYIVFHGAFQAFREGNLPLIADGERFTAFLNEHYGQWLSSPLPYHPWLYPPTFLLLLLPFGWLPFLASYLSFQIASFAALAGASWGLASRKALIPLLLLLSPAAANTLVAGQNSFLTAALVLGGFRLLPTAPVWAGILFGLLTTKPQFGLLVAVALLAGREWRAIASAAATAGLLALAALLVFGWQAWSSWFGFFLTPDPRVFQEWMEWSRMWGLSVFTCARLAGFPDSAANTLQLLVLGVTAALTWHCFRRPYTNRTRILVVMAATMLAAPHVSTYDLTWLAVVACLFALNVRDELKISEAMLLLFLWLAPVLNPPRVVPVGTLTPLLILGIIALALWQEQPRANTRDHRGVG